MWSVKRSSMRRQIILARGSLMSAPLPLDRAMLASPSGLGAGIGSGRGAGGSSLSRIIRKLLTRGNSGKRSGAIVSRPSINRSRPPPVRRHNLS
jgi:hypothetical protein